MALGWTNVRGFHTLMADAVLKGRVIPLLWASCTSGEWHHSQNRCEENFGFRRAELVRTCQALMLRYLIQIKPYRRAAHPSYTGRLNDYPLRKARSGFREDGPAL